ncbi:MAG: histidine phosphatase family protein [Bacteroidetes bacterium]|nr:histidine phosphatase family protein [Rhodothermia bacterium]MCS7155926.1 histidine phosphatase family protein [Bacteroidota bacterium]MCX7905932.1 histidine phosphatase family protein [Bacteroidota bacterium]MDW8138101.1 histidine phosphatase family protein [Bacteroidota bacterium]MDW8285785.1 histidine phosphatase family protein [Bacteroidota bacterium]
MKYFYIVRHGQTEPNRRNLLQGRGLDAPLNARGRAQAARLAERLAQQPLELIASSPLRRALETAQIIAARHPGVRVRQYPGLSEMDWGLYEGRLVDAELDAILRSLQEAWRQGHVERALPGGESPLDLQRRLRVVIEELLEDPAQHILIVGHGRMLRVLLCTLLGWGLERMEEIAHTNGALNVLRYGAGGFEALLLNDTSHLEPEPDPMSRY